VSKTKINNLLKLSRRAGERFDIVQAGGGNTSVKNDDGTMYVKASGLRLSDLKSEESFVLIDNKKLQSRFLEIDWSSLSQRDREFTAGQIVSESNLTPDRRPSIETLLHSSVASYVLHSHPVSITSFFSNRTALDKVRLHCPEFGLVPYHTPGIDLALALIDTRESYLKEFGRLPMGYVFQNHGLLTYGETWEESYLATLKMNEMISNTVGYNFQIYDLSNTISEIMEKVTGEEWLTFVSEESKFNSLSIGKTAFFPDAVVFLGVGFLDLEKNDLVSIENQIQSFIEDHSLIPKVIKFKTSLYFVAKSFIKAKEAEEVWKLHHIASQFEPDSLSNEEINYLSHWEAEKYRQKI
jgi:rhamnose utilization protein RhaD (predicted bifunctional aldolase and dehydrogenase)